MSGAGSSHNNWSPVGRKQNYPTDPHPPIAWALGAMIFAFLENHQICGSGAGVQTDPHPPIAWAHTYLYNVRDMICTMYISRTKPH